MREGLKGCSTCRHERARSEAFGTGFRKGLPNLTFATPRLRMLEHREPQGINLFYSCNVAAISLKSYLPMSCCIPLPYSSRKALAAPVTIPAKLMVGTSVVVPPLLTRLPTTAVIWSEGGTHGPQQIQQHWQKQRNARKRKTEREARSSRKTTRNSAKRWWTT